MAYNSKKRKSLLPLKFTIAFLLVPLASLNLIVDKASAGNFGATCNITTADASGVLNATCKTVKGTTVSATFPLNTYITNNNGDLQWFTPTVPNARGNFVSTCTNFYLISKGTPLVPYLTASCLRINQTRKLTQINLNERISNINGSLTYDR